MFNTSAGQSPLCLRQAVCESYERGMLHEKLFLGGSVRVKCIHFFARKLPNCPELLPCVSLLLVAPKVRTSSKLPRLMVRCAEDRLARGGEGRGSVLLTKHHVLQLRVLRPDRETSTGSMVQHFIGGLWYCGVLGAENGAFSAQFQFLLVFQCFSYCHTVLNSTRQH